MLTTPSIRRDELTTEVAVALGVGGAGAWPAALATARPDERVVLASLAASVTSLYRWLAGGGLVGAAP